MTKLLFKSFPVGEIVRSVKSRLESVPSGLTSPDYIHAKQDALRDVMAYNVRDSNGKPIPLNISSINNPQYRAALRAHEFLSKPADAYESHTVRAGKDVLRILSERQITGKQGIILLTADEHASLQRGNFSVLEKPLAADEQQRRIKMDTCVRHSFSAGVNSLGVAYHPIYDPARVQQIEEITQHDSTATWLVRDVKRNNVPILLYEYELREDYRQFQLPAARYVYSSDGYRSTEYVQLFINNSRDPELASALTHESRHHWQQHRLMSPQIYSTLSPVDILIYGMLIEADAHAIQTKSNRNFGSKVSRITTNEHMLDGFIQVFNDARNQGLSLPSKTKKATQAVFLNFLEQEFIIPSYLARGIGQALGSNRDLGPWLRALPDARFLKDEFLGELCRVGETAVYLDQEGMRRTRQLFSEKLPTVITNYRQRPNPSSTFG